jgi:hypothetical protein
VARFDEGPYFGGESGDAPRRPESLSDYPARPPATPGPGSAGPGPGASAPSYLTSGLGSPTSGPDASELPAAYPVPAFPPSDPGPGASGPQPVVNEPTQSLPTVKPLTATARAVIVYQETVRRPWRLWAFTSVLVALTVGVILGQTVAFEPTYRSGANAQAAVVPPASPASPSASAPAWPDAAHRATAPLGATKTRVLEVIGNSAVLNVRSADLGKNLYDIATIDRSAVPQLTTTKRGATLKLIPTGDDGTVGAEIQLNSKVAWTLKLSGGLNEQTVDMQAGGVAGLQLTGGSAHIALLLPAPKGTVPLSVKGPLGDLTVSTRTGVPLRLQLTDGAASAVVDGKLHREVKPGTTLTSAGWTKAENRYDLTTTGKIATLFATTSAPAASPSASPSPSAH